MKALILAAGFGTRLAPYTNHLPKALFPLAGIPVLARMMANLKRAGCTGIAVNAHHLADQIQAFLDDHAVGIPITLSHEHEILGTGGAIRRLASYWDGKPFMVVNADIVTDIDLARVYQVHLANPASVTLVLHDRPPFNQVWVDDTRRIVGFARFCDGAEPNGALQLAFTGIHIIDADVLDWIPASGFCDIIAVYRQMIDKGIPIHAHVAKHHYWQDMGTPERFRDAVVDIMAPQAFQSAFPGYSTDNIRRRPLSGDGSDRRWFRLTSDRHHLILADHGITPTPEGSEVNAFIHIGKHLFQCGLPVPRIVAHDEFSGLVFLEDLGDCHLQRIVSRDSHDDHVRDLYRQVIDTLLNITIQAAAGFNPDWTCQSRAYDTQLIIEKECRYFVDAFLNGYLNLDVKFEDLATEFDRLARRTVAHAVQGLIHRDFQSRNIMVHDGRHYLIDFQGARSGPIQYDLASLLIDPYVALSDHLRQDLLTYATQQAAVRLHCASDRFIRGYRYCAVTRNLQMLGAFGFLSRVKGKNDFEAWIPAASAMLAGHIRLADENAFPRLFAMARRIGKSERHPS
ncbi:aminoglycoside phosphotransferase [Desulfosarcina variabilis str. Montpellier]|uniref:phosphotransferase n=1 Tax=Desulfosarcina variabilis TaxID=2300 RepID=UPI003AFA2897